MRIREIEQKDIAECVNLIRESFFTVAEELGCVKINIRIVEENQVLKHWYEKQGFVHIRVQKFDFFPFTCGSMEKNL